MTSKDPVQSEVQPSVEPVPARDLADFFLRWPSFRPTALTAAAAASLSANEREIVGWLIKLADRVGERDLFRSEETTEGGVGDPALRPRRC